MRLMRHKTADLTMGTYDKVEDTELRRELERLPVANALRMAAGAESASVPVQVNQGPNGGRSGHFWADRGRCDARSRIGEWRPNSRFLAGIGRSWQFEAGARSAG